KPAFLERCRREHERLADQAKQAALPKPGFVPALLFPQRHRRSVGRDKPEQLPRIVLILLDGRDRFLSEPELRATRACSDQGSAIRRDPVEGEADGTEQRRAGHRSQVLPPRKSRTMCSCERRCLRSRSVARAADPSTRSTPAVAATRWARTRQSSRS